MQPDVDRIGQAGVVELEHPPDRSARAERIADVADGVPHADALDADRKVRRRPHLVQGVLAAPPGARAIERPGLLEGEVSDGLGDAEEGDEGAQASRLEGATREAEKVNLVARLIVGDELLVGVADAIANAEPDRPFQELRRFPLGVGDARDVVRDLAYAVGIDFGDERLQLGDVRLYEAGLVVVPGAVQAEGNSLHSNSPSTHVFARSRHRAAQWRRRTHPANDTGRQSGLRRACEKILWPAGNVRRLTIAPQCT